MIKKNIILSLFLSTLLVYTGCQRELPGPEPVVVEEKEKERYVSSELLATVPHATLQLLVGAQGFEAYRDQIKHGVSVYRMVYHTSYRGEEIKASGLVCVPVGLAAPAPVLSAQHGTIFTQAEAPSNFTGLSGFELFAAGGYLTLIPDYIGFGESKQIFHPYYDQQHSALAVVDMVKAGKSFFKEKNLPVNDQLFLVGYSEGGYVTLAAQEEIETEPKHKLTVTASAAGAGGYDLVSMLKDVTSGQPYTYPAYLAYLLQAYNYTNDWKRPLTDLFGEPYASRLPTLFDGTKNGGAINQQLTTDPQRLFAPAFFADLKQADRERDLKKALADNSFPDWVPQSPMRLYHGTADEVVPVKNSEETYRRFKGKGAPRLELITIPGTAHGTTIGPMLLTLIPWIESFR